MGFAAAACAAADVEFELASELEFVNAGVDDEVEFTVKIEGASFSSAVECDKKRNCSLLEFTGDKDVEDVFGPLVDDGKISSPSLSERELPLVILECVVVAEFCGSIVVDIWAIGSVCSADCSVMFSNRSSGACVARKSSREDTKAVEPFSSTSRWLSGRLVARNLFGHVVVFLDEFSLSEFCDSTCALVNVIELNSMPNTNSSITEEDIVLK